MVKSRSCLFIKEETKVVLLLLSFLFVLFSCGDRNKDKIAELVEKWNGQVLYFPDKTYFTVMGEDTVSCDSFNTEYRIITYADSTGCISCKLKLAQWKTFIMELDSIRNVSVSLFLHPRSRKELISVLKVNRFTYPVCIDEHDSFNKLNHFPSDMMFQTFLLDKSNKVVAIGNPMLNPKVKELYLDIIQGRKSKKKLELTTAALDKTLIELPAFDWKQEKNVEIILTNTGSQPLVVDDVVSSCDCTTVEYSKNPVSPGNSMKIFIKYKARQPEAFYRTVSVYCNTKESPLEIEIKGECR